ncbi:MAG: citrate lyase holo-[Oscillospiraceae bacterium]|nr:citrate lyase holo-[acyl-carrier protein] synthase [Oscillospiraceae bacterium]
MEEVTLEQVLAAQDARTQRQNALLERYHMPVISFSMNLPGPVKDSPLIRRAYFTGRDTLLKSLRDECIKVLRKEETLAATGFEIQIAVKEEALTVKKLCVQIEDATTLGRLFNMDVLAADASKLDREEVGGSERGCIVCGAAGRGCASRRAHSVEELQAAARRIMVEYYAKADRQDVADKVTAALLEEVYTTPKPGLVDRANTGSHSDMTIETFERSAKALKPYWAHCVETGQKTAGAAPDETFSQLRELGKAAERDMLAATGGVNTHKGTIFTLGTVCGAIGRLWKAETPYSDVETITSECAAMTKAAVKADFAALTPDTARTTGEKLYLESGLRGIRGEMADGLLSVKNIALPMLHDAMEAGYNRNRAGVYALLALIARGRDTNMIARGGRKRAAVASKWAEELLFCCDFPPLTAVEVLNRKFVAENLSPGGCADLLATAYFLDSI